MANHKTRIEIIRKDIVVHTIDPKMDSSPSNLSIKTNASLFQFPMMDIKSSDSELNAALMDYSKTDLIRLLIAKEDEMHTLLYEGEFYKKDISFVSAGNSLTINTEAIHSFFKLSLYEFPKTQDFDNISFGDFVSMLVNFADINSKLIISPEIAELRIKGRSNRTNAFRLFKEICILKDAFVRFNSDNSVSIETRSNAIAKMKSMTPLEITDKDIDDFSSSESVKD